MEQQRFQHEEPTAVPRIIEQLSSKKAEQRAEAEQALEQMGPEAVDALLALLNREAGKRKRNKRIYVGFVTGLAAMILLLTLTGHGDQVGSFSSMFGAFAGLMAASKLQKDTARRLAKYDDIRAVGPLAEALFFDDKNVRAEAEGALIHLLPGMKASDAGYLNDDQRHCLNRALRGKNAELTLAILTAYEQVGDEKALPHVQRLANGEAATAKEKRIREAAQRCLPFLTERIAQERARQTLLRPASAPDDPAAILLRPAQGVSEADPNLLLRPSAPEERPQTL